ncbi:MAG: nucleotide exchange factor GrpE [Pseudomonadota bacterium]
MSQGKDRVEPEVSMPEAEAAANQTATPQPGATSGAGAAPGSEEFPDTDLTVEDLVPGLEEELGAAAPDPLVETVARLEAECAELKDKWTRQLAETENVRRRAERDRQDAQTYGGTKLARDLLSVYDNLDRALQAAGDDVRAAAPAFIEGVELTQRELLNAFGKHKIEKVTPEVGEKFDPNRHQAMFEAPIAGAEPNTVIECMQSGFVIADRLLRPAMVGVAKAMPTAEAAAAEAPADGDPKADPA